MGYYVPNRAIPVCYNCPYRTNKYCGLLTEHDYLGGYPLNYEPYPYCPLVEVEDEPQTDYTPDCPFCKRYGTEDCLGSDCRHYKTYKTEPQTERSSE